MARIIVLSNPLNPHDRVEYEWVGPYCSNDGESGFLNREYPDGFPGTHRTFLNREYLPVEDYDRRLGPRDEVVLLVTPGIFGAIVAAIGAIASAVASSAVLSSLAVGLALTAVSYLLAPKPGKLATPQSPASLAKPKAESVYNLALPTNQTRLGDVIPVHYGNLRITPDYAAYPYSLYENNEQYVYMLFCLGQGEYEFGDIIFGNTPARTLAPGIVTHQFFWSSQHNQTIGEIEAAFGLQENCHTSEEVTDLQLEHSYQELLFEVSAPTEIKGLTSFEALQVGTDIQADDGKTYTITNVNGDRFNVNPDPADPVGPHPIGTQLRGFYLLPINTFWINVCGEQDVTSLIAYDLVYRQGLYFTEDDGSLSKRNSTLRFKIEEIDSSGNVVAGGYAHTETITVTDATVTPKRLTHSIAVPENRYRTEVTNLSVKSDKGGRVGDDVWWTQLKAFDYSDYGQPGYGDVSLLALKVKATQGLSPDVLNRVSVQVNRRLHGVPTRNAIDAFRDIYMNPHYGAARPVAELDGTLTGTFDASFDFDTNVWEALTTVVQCVAGQILPIGRQIRIKSGDPSVTPRMRFKEGTAGAGLIVDGSLVRRYALGNRSEEDGIEVEYRDFQTHLPAYELYPNNSVRPREVKLLGCIDPNIAQARAKRIWQEEQYNRFIWSFESELDALVLEPGDTIEITPLYGQPVLCVVSEVEHNGPYRSSIVAFEYDARVYT